MLSNRSLLLATACVLPLSVAACGSSSDSGTAVPEGTHYGYVVSKANVVAPSGHSPSEYGLDLGGATSATPDGKVDNRLGQALGALSGFFNVQGTVDTAVAKGTLILLVDFQTKDFTNSSAAGLAVKFGANPIPAACTDANDTTCGHHLDGSAKFSLATNSPTDAALAGKIVNGTFNSDPGDVSLQLAIGSTTPIELNLLHARAKASTISATGITTLTVGGLLTLSDLTTKVGPAIQASVASLITADCTVSAGPPGCGCKVGSTGAQVISILDGDLTGSARDCAVSVEELLGYPVVSSLLMPDSCSKDSCTAADSLSVGIQVTAVKATIQ
jgi:hypothetical protein